ncbi:MULTISPECIES: 5-histidylcysteine sulfoxide synthase [unclassified Sulfuricurvum]|uniref:5-histidylcysteine sulfoxide synthase n=1 Tax=unclassified Sulfuricurvum TaxID=2632390 RepID=UPI000323B814|nr:MULTISPECIES: 5-histidylcysteine sulfoxide synthase [unclassified Sulfuricurvum]
MLQRQMKSVRLDGVDTTLKRSELQVYFHQSFNLFESLFELLKSDDVYYLQSEPTRHPMIFYFGHTAIFYINKLVASGALKERINPHFEELFAVGVDEMTWDASSDSLKWPSVDEVRGYRQKVRLLVDEMIMTLPMKLPIMKEDPLWAIWMGIEHERIHIETSSVLHRQMALEFILPHEDFLLCPVQGDTPENALVSFSASKVSMGKGSADQGLYGWDNEYGHAQVSVEAFQASRYLVSNGEFMDFVMANGYKVSRWWDEEGLRYLQIRKATCPPFWIPQEEGTYKYRSLTHEIDMPYNWPVEVNALEAEAFCRWKSAQEGMAYRLPTEAEWRVMVEAGGIDEEIFDDERANINLAHFASSVPVDTFAHGELYDVAGNVWQWTQTQMDGFDGFVTHPWYDDFSEPTFDGRHNLIKGGSWISTGNEILLESRYAFRRHFIQHAGFRYVVGEGANESDKYANIDQMYARWVKRYG